MLLMMFVSSRYRSKIWSYGPAQMTLGGNDGADEWRATKRRENAPFASGFGRKPFPKRGAQLRRLSVVGGELSREVAD